MKAKAKADRAAARQAAAAALGPALDLFGGSGAGLPGHSVVADDNSVAEGTTADSQSVQDGEELSSSAQPKEAAPDRTELLRSKPEAVGRFLRLLVPILVDVYAASVMTPVRIKTLTGLLKAVSFLDGEELNRVFTVCRCFVSRLDTSDCGAVCPSR